MSGYYTPGLPAVTGALTGYETFALDTNIAAGGGAETVQATSAQALGVIPATSSAGSVTTAPFNTAYAATATINGNNGLIQTVGALTGAITLSWSNITPGLTYRIKLVQDATGSRTATLTGGSTTWKVSGSQSTTASYIDWLTVYFDGQTYWGIWNVHFA